MKFIHLISFVLIFCVFSISCGDSRKAGIKVTAEEFGDKWPFTEITEGYVKCENNAAIFSTNGKNYSLNGLAKSKYNYPFPYESGIVKKIPISSKNPKLGSINADVEVLRKLCDQ